MAHMFSPNDPVMKGPNIDIAECSQLGPMLLTNGYGTSVWSAEHPLINCASSATMMVMRGDNVDDFMTDYNNVDNFITGNGSLVSDLVLAAEDDHDNQTQSAMSSLKKKLSMYCNRSDYGGNELSKGSSQLAGVIYYTDDQPVSLMMQKPGTSNAHELLNTGGLLALPLIRSPLAAGAAELPAMCTKNMSSPSRTCSKGTTHQNVLEDKITCITPKCEVSEVSQSEVEYDHHHHHYHEQEQSCCHQKSKAAYKPNNKKRINNNGQFGSSSNTTTKMARLDTPPDVVHVRARRGQATDSHSLAERVRREKINQRMKVLQAIVPGCHKMLGKAMMLDEIINYVKSLQKQVEFLSMKLATANQASTSSPFCNKVNISSLSADPFGDLN